MNCCPLTILTPLDIIKFWSKITIDRHERECWDWIYNKQIAARKPRPHYSRQGHSWAAARVAYVLFYGCVEDSKTVIMHLCDNEKCVNPFHLLAGTSQENTVDYFFKKKNPNLETITDILKRLKIENLYS